MNFVSENSTNAGLKKKEEENAENENVDAQTLKPNRYYVIEYILYFYMLCLILYNAI